MSYPARTKVPEEYLVEPKATQPQITFICDLLDKRNLMAWPVWWDATNAMDHEEYAAQLEHYKTVQVPALTKKRASDLITILKSLPWAPREDKISETVVPARGTVHQPSSKVFVEYEDVATDKGTKRFGKLVLAYDPGAKNVLKGSYGVDTSKNDRFKNEMSFFKVWVGDRGGWDVRLYVSDDTRRVELAYDVKLWALSEIAKDPEAASRLFGLEFGKCGVCGRGLTNDLSRELGIGPVCRENVGRY